jgi:hypothetical protein
MGKAKKEKPSQAEKQLKDEVKKQKEIVRHLEREIKKSKQPKGKPKEYQDSLIEEDYDDKTLCPQCGKGTITTTDLGVRTIIGCSNGCGHRQVIKNVKKEKDQED